MPTPLEILVDPVALVVIAIYLVLIGVESLRPAQSLSRIRGWQLRTRIVRRVLLPVVVFAHPLG